jgi:hypothetical protein
MVKKVKKFNKSFFKNLPKELFDQLINYDDKALPELILGNLYDLTPNFKDTFNSKANNYPEYDSMYCKQRVDMLELGINKSIEQGYQDIVDFIEEFPEFTPMIAEWDSEEFHA